MVNNLEQTRKTRYDAILGAIKATTQKGDKVDLPTLRRNCDKEFYMSPALVDSYLRQMESAGEIKVNWAEGTAIAVNPSDKNTGMKL